MEGLFAEASFSAYQRHYKEGSFGFAHRSKKCEKGDDERLPKPAAKTLFLWLPRQAAEASAVCAECPLWGYSQTKTFFLLQEVYARAEVAAFELIFHEVMLQKIPGASD